MIQDQVKDKPCHKTTVVATEAKFKQGYSVSDYTCRKQLNKH